MYRATRQENAFARPGWPKGHKSTVTRTIRVNKTGDYPGSQRTIDISIIANAYSYEEFLYYRVTYTYNYEKL